MATVDELLAGEMTEVEQALTIDWESRTINIPKTITNIGVESDDGVNELYFRVPQYYDGTDLSEFSPRINYLNANKEGDVYRPIDVRIKDEWIEFTWVVGRHTTMYKGNVMFNVCMVVISNEGVVIQEVNTTPATLPALEGLETSEAVVDEHIDALTTVALDAINRALDTDLKGEPGYTPVKGTDYYTEQERNEFADSIVRDHNGAFANALKGTASGTVIRIDDVSPIDHTVKARVGGKNLVPLSYKTAHPGVVRNEDGSIQFTSDGVLTEYYEMRIINIGDKSLYLEPGKYSFKLIGAPIGAHFVIGGGCATYTESPSGTLTVEQAGYINYIIVRFAPGYEYDCTVYPMFVKGDIIPTEYEPYIDPASVTLKAYGKNLINVEDATLRDCEGYYYEISTGFEPVLGGKYVLSLDLTCDVMPTSVAVGCGVNNFKAELTPFCAKDYYASGHVEVPFTWNITEENIRKGETKLAIRVPRYNESKVFNATVRNFQLEIGDTATSYEPFRGIEYTPAADGTVDIVSVSPTMTLMTDTPGVTIEAEYSKDINCLHAANVEKEVEALKAKIEGMTNGLIVKDRTTGKTHTVYISDGKLMME